MTLPKIDCLILHQGAAVQQWHTRVPLTVGRPLMSHSIDEERPVLLSVHGDRLAFQFTRAEARELEELLDGAAAMLDLGEIVDDALGSDPPKGTRS